VYRCFFCGIVVLVWLWMAVERRGNRHNNALPAVREKKSWLRRMDAFFLYALPFPPRQRHACSIGLVAVRVCLFLHRTEHHHCFPPPPPVLLQAPKFFNPALAPALYANTPATWHRPYHEDDQGLRYAVSVSLGVDARGVFGCSYDLLPPLWQDHH